MDAACCGAGRDPFDDAGFGAFELRAFAEFFEFAGGVNGLRPWFGFALLFPPLFFACCCELGRLALLLFAALVAWLAGIGARASLGDIFGA